MVVTDPAGSVTSTRAWPARTQLLSVGHAALPEPPCSGGSRSGGAGPYVRPYRRTRTRPPRRRPGGRRGPRLRRPARGAPGETGPARAELQRQPEAEPRRSRLGRWSTSSPTRVKWSTTSSRARSRPIIAPPRASPPSRRGRHPDVTGNTIFPVTWPPLDLRHQIHDLRSRCSGLECVTVGEDAFPVTSAEKGAMAAAVHRFAK